MIIVDDLFSSDAQYIAHQTNCISTRSAHLAQAMFRKFPHADVYSERKQQDTPGTIVIRGNGKDQRYVINMMAQVYPGAPKYPESSKDGHEARQRYFYSCLRHIAKIENLQSVAFPYRVGCGSAGGNWEFYFELLNRFQKAMEKKNATVLIYKLTGEA